MSAAGTDIGVDGDMIAGGRDRAGRAEIEAARAPTIFEREWAQRSAVNAVARLIETADQVARLQHGLEDGRGIAGIGPR